MTFEHQPAKGELRVKPSAGDVRIHSLSSPFAATVEAVQANGAIRRDYLVSRGKADKALFLRSTTDTRNGVELNRQCPFEGVIAGLIDAPELQRLRFVNQLSTASMVYPDATHARFTHVLGSAYLTAKTIKSLHKNSSEQIRREIELWGPVVVAFALTHDLGHCAPGSHLAQKIFFPNSPDAHEETTHRIFRENMGFRARLESIISSGAADRLEMVAGESPEIPAWTYQLVTGGVWNTDRGDWVERDSHHCGITTGQCETALIIRNLRITSNGQLVVLEAGVPALETFFHARTRMYLDVYNHGTGRIADSMHESLLRRVRESYKRGDLTFADNAMQAVLNATEINELPLETIMNMTEHWWGYHLLQWSKEADPIVADLATRLLTRSLFKEWQDSPENRQLIRAFVESSRFDPHYYYAELPSRDVKVGKDLSVGMKVQRSDGSLVAITEYSQSLGALAEIGTFSAPPIIAAPMEIWQRGQPQ